MGVTNGFLRLSQDEFSTLSQDADAFVKRCTVYDHPDYLDMDKAGFELLLMLDPVISNPDNPDVINLLPGITATLGSGTVIHEDHDMGYGPAHRIDDTALKNALAEFEKLTSDECFAMASAEIVAELLSIDLDEESFLEYHWHYLQLLREFIAEAVARNMVVLRY